MATNVLHNDDTHVISDNLETFTLIWLDGNVNNIKNSRNSEQELRNVINHFKKFDDEQICRQYIEHIPKEERLVLIVNDQLGQRLLPQIHCLRQLCSIYIYGTDKKRHKEWMNEFTKIEAVTVEIDELIAHFTSDQKKRMKKEEPLLINIFSTTDGAEKSTTGLNGQFVYSQLLIDCLLRMKSSQTDKDVLISLCQKEYEGNRSQLTILQEFQRYYSSDKALWWYTRASFFYRILNKALRVQSIEMLFLLRSFISDISYQLQCYQLKSAIRVYRSQLMASDEISTMKQHIGQLISINSFLSTSVQRETALFLMGGSGSTNGLQQVLFEIDADPRVLSIKPFADVSCHSEFPMEMEILFMLGSIFRLNNITLNNDDQLWTIHMTLCGDDEYDLKQVLVHMKNQNGSGETDLRTLAKILWKMGKFDLAEEYYHRLINETASNDPTLIRLYEDLSEIASQKGDYDMSIQWCNKALEIRSENPLSNDANIRAIASSVDLPDHYNAELEEIIKQSKIHSKMILIKKGLIDQDMKTVVKEIIIDKQCPSLWLDENSISRNGVSILADGLQNNYTLVRLSLGHNRLGDLGVQSLVKTLSLNNNILQILNLQNTGITDDGAEYVAQMLKTNRTLTDLNLGLNTISDEGVAMLANALQLYNNTLESLNLNCNKLMTDASVDFLFELIRSTRSLKMFSAHNCNLTRTGEERLRKAAQLNKNIKVSVNNFWKKMDFIRFGLLSDYLNNF